MYLETVHIKWASVLSPKRVMSSISVTKFFVAGFTARIFPYEARGHKYISCNSKAWQSEWGFIFPCVYESETKEYVARLLAASLVVSLERKARQSVSFWAFKKKQTMSRRVQDGEKKTIHEMHTYMIG